MMPAVTPACAPDPDRIADRQRTADQLPHARPLPVPGPRRMRARHRHRRVSLVARPARRSGDTARYASQRTDVLRLRSLLPLGRVELDLLVLIQRPVAGAQIAEKCTNTSAVPSSGAMKPKPLSALNHFTVPVAISPRPLPPCHNATCRADPELPVPAPAPGPSSFPVFRDPGRRVSPTPAPASIPAPSPARRRRRPCNP